MLIKANYYSLSPRRFIAGTKNSYGIETLGFEFSPEWDGLSKKVTFYPEAGSPVSVVYAGDPIKIPAEVMAREGLATFVLSGYRDGATLISVTGYMDVLDTKLPSGGEPAEPTPDEMAQVMALMNKAIETAESVRRDADLGLFNGEKGEKGDSGSIANVSEIVTAVKNALPATDADEMNALANTVELEPVFISNFITEKHYFPYSATVPTVEGTVSFIKIPCRKDEIYRVSFRGTVGAGTPCFIQDKDSRGIKTVIANENELNQDSEKIFCVPQNGAYIVLNYVSSIGLPHVYRYRSSDPTVWGLPSYWFKKLELVTSTVNEYQNICGVNGFTFGFITDTHAPLNHGGAYARLMKHVMNSCEIPLFIHGGDVVEGSGGISRDQLLDEIRHHKEIFSGISEKCLQVFGNHDASYGIKDNFDGSLTKAEIYNAYFRANESRVDLVRGETGKYYYVDNRVQKVRYIILDGYAVADNAMTNESRYGAQQLAWLAEALNVERGYSTVISSHIAPYRRIDLDAIGWTAENAPLDAHIALGIVNAYRNKTGYSVSETVGGELYGISADYANAEGSVVCWISGHTHKDYIFNIDGLSIITVANCGAHVSVNPVGFAPQKDFGTDAEFIMDFVCVNKEKGSVNIVRLGADMFNDPTCISIRHFDYKRNESGGSNGAPAANTFSVSNFYHTSPNGDNTFSFEEGMTWAQWKASEYNKFSWYEDGFDDDNYYQFSTNESEYTNVDVSWWDTDLEGICNADGTPVKDNEVIQAATYIYNTCLNEYGGNKTCTLANETGYDSIESFLIIQFKEGMTWSEWLESDYNTQGYYSGQSEATENPAFIPVAVQPETPVWGVLDTNGNLVQANDVILEGSGNYTLADVTFLEEGSGGSGDNGDSSDNGDSVKKEKFTVFCGSDFGNDFKFEFTEGQTIGEALNYDGDHFYCPQCGAELAYSGDPDEPMEADKMFACSSYVGQSRNLIVECGSNTRTLSFTTGQTLGEVLEFNSDNIAICPGCGSPMESNYKPDDLIRVTDNEDMPYSYYCTTY